MDNILTELKKELWELDKLRLIAIRENDIARSQRLSNRVFDIRHEIRKEKDFLKSQKI